MQIRVKASDAGVPPRTATAMVEVKVQRDEGELKFSKAVYTIEVSENRKVNDPIGNVQASPGVSVTTVWGRNMFDLLCMIFIQQIIHIQFIQIIRFFSL